MENSPIEKVNNWIKNSVTLKLITITILMLLLLIPASMIDSIIDEREQLNSQATTEVSSKWAEKQQINGPILTIPLIYEYEKDEKIITTTRYWYILPENLKVDGEIEPEKLRRGIYEVVVYKSNLSVSGNFLFDQHPDKTNLKEIKYDQSFLTIGISDLRGIKNQIAVKWGDQNLSVKPGSKISHLIYSGITVDLPNLENLINQSVNFDFQLDLQGSQNMSFVPIGSTTKVQLKSAWNSPSFDGNFLPDSRELNDDGFSARWSILQLNRNFPQSWVDTDQSKKMDASAFGVNLILPLDDYQKSMRSSKYAVMTIALTFLIFFLVEILNKRKIHPFQYALVGLALCIFYILLVSITEHSNFNFAYGISALGIVSMITLYSLSIFHAKKLTILLVSTLLGIYGFLFVTLQLADYALLMGSIGLTVILGATMYFTRRINWYKLNIETE
ncbi:cell envelope integrity protein CreD [Reichenbachiella sp. MALMAid0571]|uniref:cell envelope integrity protein CreD n=1 Tax=Reichenbachiella sp. MALMAid0571 TaxID=3143939 RepID=UPI0032DEA986